MLAACLLLGMITGVVPALAHAELVSSVPPPGAELRANALPDEIRLTFNEPLGGGSRIQLFAAGFQEVPGVEARVNPEAREQLFAPLPALEPGEYSVGWTAVSVDGHIVTGSYSFSVVSGGPGAGLWWVAGAAGAGIIVGFVVAFSRRRAT